MQIQLDSLINDITAYGKSIPSSPDPMKYWRDPDWQDPIKKNELWDKFNQEITAYYTTLNSDFFSKFDARIGDTLIKLHDLKISSDSEFDSDKHLYGFMPTAYTEVPILLPKLYGYKVLLDKYVKNLLAGTQKRTGMGRSKPAT